jgi:hypothetical protein
MQFRGVILAVTAAMLTSTAIAIPTESTSLVTKCLDIDTKYCVHVCYGKEVKCYNKTDVSLI